MFVYAKDIPHVGTVLYGRRAEPEPGLLDVHRDDGFLINCENTVIDADAGIGRANLAGGRRTTTLLTKSVM